MMTKQEHIELINVAHNAAVMFSQSLATNASISEQDITEYTALVSAYREAVQTAARDLDGNETIFDLREALPNNARKLRSTFRKRHGIEVPMMWQTDPENGVSVSFILTRSKDTATTRYTDVDLTIDWGDGTPPERYTTTGRVLDSITVEHNYVTHDTPYVIKMYGDIGRVAANAQNWITPKLGNGAFLAWGETVRVSNGIYTNFFFNASENFRYLAVDVPIFDTPDKFGRFNIGALINLSKSVHVFDFSNWDIPSNTIISDMQNSSTSEFKLPADLSHVDTSINAISSHTSRYEYNTKFSVNGPDEWTRDVSLWCRNSQSHLNFIPHITERITSIINTSVNGSSDLLMQHITSFPGLVYTSSVTTSSTTKYNTQGFPFIASDGFKLHYDTEGEYSVPGVKNTKPYVGNTKLQIPVLLTEPEHEVMVELRRDVIDSDTNIMYGSKLVTMTSPEYIDGVGIIIDLKRPATGEVTLSGHCAGWITDPSKRQRHCITGVKVNEYALGTGVTFFSNPVLLQMDDTNGMMSHEYGLDTIHNNNNNHVWFTYYPENATYRTISLMVDIRDIQFSSMRLFYNCVNLSQIPTGTKFNNSTTKNWNHLRQNTISEYDAPSAIQARWWEHQ